MSRPPFAVALTAALWASCAAGVTAQSGDARGRGLFPVADGAVPASMRRAADAASSSASSRTSRPLEESAGGPRNAPPRTTALPGAEPPPLRIGAGAGADAGDGDARGRSGWGTLWATLGVLGLVVVAARVWKTVQPHRASATTGPLETLARVRVEGRQSVQLVRVGGRILVLGVAADGLTPLSEITEPDEVATLTAACRGTAPEDRAGTSASRESFRVRFGRTAEDGEPPLRTPPPPRGESPAERRLAERLRGGAGVAGGAG